MGERRRSGWKITKITLIAKVRQLSTKHIQQTLSLSPRICLRCQIIVHVLLQMSYYLTTLYTNSRYIYGQTVGEQLLVSVCQTDEREDETLSEKRYKKL